MPNPLDRLRPRVPAARSLLLALFGIVVTGVSATATAMVAPRGPVVALSGSTPVHGQKTASTLLTDFAPPAETSTVPLTIPAGGRAEVPILLYHYIRTADPKDNLAFNLSIDPALFALQMALLHVEGAHPITLATLMSALDGKVGLPPHPVVLTFDDGYADFATAAVPVLSRFNFVGTDYVVSGFMDRPGYMTPDQVKEVDRAGMVVAAHTVHHVDLTHVTDARDEITNSRTTLEKLVGHPVLDFAYPYGFYNAGVLKLVAEAGYRDATSTNWGTIQSLDERLVLPRLRVGGAPTLSAFAAEAGLPSPTADQRSRIQQEANTDYQAPHESAAPPAQQANGTGGSGAGSGGGSTGSGGGGSGGSGGGSGTPPTNRPTATPTPTPQCKLPPPLC